MQHLISFLHISIPVNSMRMKCDIAYFQETHFDQNIENEINFNTDFNVYGSIGTSALCTK
jgi:hypothetical protein